MQVHLALSSTAQEGAALSLKGFDVCYGLGGDVDCALEPVDGSGVHRTFVEASGDLSQPVQLMLFDSIDQQRLFGPDFSAQTISVWFDETNTEGCCRFFVTDLFLIRPDDLTCCSLAEWNLRALGGDTEPKAAGWGSYQQPTQITVGLRAQAEMAGGNLLESTWFHLPVEICVGCSLSHHDYLGCEPMVGEFCDYGICHLDEGDYGEGETAPCTASGCELPEKPCYHYSYQLRGERPQVEGCIPAQLQGITQRCEAELGCGR